MSARTLRTVVRLAVEVDLEAWRLEYGSDESAAEVRASLRRNLEDAARIAYAHLGRTVRIEEVTR